MHRWGSESGSSHGNRCGRSQNLNNRSVSKAGFVLSDVKIY
jgi:hypothetical protein